MPKAVKTSDVFKNDVVEKVIPYNQLGKAGYNRVIRRWWVNKIKRDFDERLVEPIIVSYRDGKYWIIDHQHLAQAIYELNGNDPNTRLMCKVYNGLTYQEESDLFTKMNTKKLQMQKREEIVGLIAAEEPDAIRFRDLVERCGYVIELGRNDSLSAISTAWNVFNKPNGETLLMTVLEITYESWPGIPKGVERNMINGLLLFLRHHEDEYDRSRLIAKLSRVEPREILTTATAIYSGAVPKSWTKAYCVYIRLLETYNERLRNKLVQAIPGK